MTTLEKTWQGLKEVRKCSLAGCTYDMPVLAAQEKIAGVALSLAGLVKGEYSLFSLPESPALLSANGKSPLTPDDYYERYYSQGDSLWLELLGSFPLGDCCPDGGIWGYAIDALNQNRTWWEGQDYLKCCEVMDELLKGRSDPSIASEVLCVPEGALVQMPAISAITAELVKSDPEGNEGEVCFITLSSSLVGAALGCPDIPEEEKTTLNQLVKEVSEPLLNWFQVEECCFEGCWYSVLLYGTNDYQVILLDSFDPSWLPACHLLKKEIRRLNRKYHFLGKEKI